MGLLQNLAQSIQKSTGAFWMLHTSNKFLYELWKAALTQCVQMCSKAQQQNIPVCSNVARVGTATGIFFAWPAIMSEISSKLHQPSLVPFWAGGSVSCWSNGHTQKTHGEAVLCSQWDSISCWHGCNSRISPFLGWPGRTALEHVSRNHIAKQSISRIVQWAGEGVVQRKYSS